MIEPIGYLSLVLHAHLPFIRHPENPDFLEEDWFFEAVVETYAPLLRRFEKLRSENIPFRLTMSVTPPLATMLEDYLLRARLARYIDLRIELMEKEIKGNRGTHLEYVARHYYEEFVQTRSFIFNNHHGHLLESFRSLYESGHLELITCTATHGFLPLMSRKSSWDAQIQSAVETHKKFFGRKPRGIWLAECAYETGVDKVLTENGIEYTFVDTHGVLFGEPQPVYGVYAPVMTPSGLNVFARDQESSKQVWSQKEGYPGDFNYREFYRDLGYDANYEYIKPYLHSDAVRRGIGIKYHKITGDVDLSQKDFYDPIKADQKAAEHAGNFVFNRQAQVKHLRDLTKYPPILVAPYDAELFGHWWYEGPAFIEYLIRKVAFDQREIELISPVDFLDRHPIRQLQNPNPSTWGSEGHNLVWLNGGNSWLYRHQHRAEQQYEELSHRFKFGNDVVQRILQQLKRELLLLQSSDWAFILTTGTTVPYATRRFREHMNRFQFLSDQLTSNQFDLSALSALESRDCIF